MELVIAIDPDLCIGSGDCVRAVPGAFRLDDRAGVTSPTDAAPAAAADALLGAARNCPTQAISLVRDGIVLHGCSTR